MSEEKKVAKETKAESKNSITVIFGEEDKAIYEAIIQAAAADERSVPKYLLRHLRTTVETAQ